MAQLIETPKLVCDRFEFKSGEDFEAYLKRANKALKEMEKLYPIIGFSVADGRALYAVVSMKPLQLMHIPYGDGYRVQYPMIRGLRVQDVKQMLKRNENLKAMFS